MPEPAAMPGLHYDELTIGRRWISATRTITEADIVAFAGVSGDFNPIHVDAQHAARTAFGERIAHGALVLAVATGLRQQQDTFRGTLKAWLGIEDWRFRTAVRIGDSIHVVTEIAARRETRDPTAGLITQAITVVNQRDEIVADGTFATLVATRTKATT